MSVSLRDYSSTAVHPDARDVYEAAAGILYSEADPDKPEGGFDYAPKQAVVEESEMNSGYSNQIRTFDRSPGEKSCD